MNSISINNQQKNINNSLLGMVFVVATEVMLFGGFISAFIVNKSVTSEWPPAGQPRLPIFVTSINTIFLVLSAIFLFLFNKKHNQFSDTKSSTGFNFNYLKLTMFLGLLFIIIQGSEWVNLISFGLTATSSLYGSFFYLIIGMHAFHVLIGLSLLYYLYKILKKSNCISSVNKIPALSLYWYFVVGVWPFLYVLVYLT